jgi:hypothetical protein
MGVLVTILNVFLLHIFILPFLLWIGYLASMNLIRVYETTSMPRPTLYVGYIVVGITYIADLWLNYTVATLLFWDFPIKVTYKTEGTFSYRLGIYKGQEKGWRYSLTKDVIAPMFLDPFDPKGQHIFPVESPKKINKE